MEKILNDNEKIRRAEEIYYRRNNRNTVIEKGESGTKNVKIVKNKILLHLLIMFNISIIIFCVQNKDFVFTQEFLSTLNQYNLDISSQIVSYMSSLISNNQESPETNNQKVENNILENINQNNITVNEVESQNVVSNISNEIQNITSTVPTFEQSASSMSEMELDILNLKAAYSFIKPLENAIITSRFGTRVSDNPDIEGYHTGMDFAAEQGTDIKASMGGIVTLVSNNGDYGKHVKIRCNNITTVYAHCSKIHVKEGQIVAQGQVIAAVGNTGNSTGPHLHFEIRIDDRYVNPEKVL